MLILGATIFDRCLKKNSETVQLTNKTKTRILI